MATELTQAKLDKIAAITATTESLLASGFPFLDQTYSLASDNTAAFTGLMTAAAQGGDPPYPSIVSVAGVSYSPADLAELTDFVTTGQGFYHDIAVPHMELVGEVAAATTVEAVDAITDDRGELPPESRPPVVLGTVDAPAPGAKVKLKVVWQLNCKHLGDKIQGRCGSRLYRCDFFGDTTDTLLKCEDADRTCTGCPEYVKGERKKPAPPDNPKLVKPPAVGGGGPRIGPRLLLSAAVGPNGKEWLEITRGRMETAAAKWGAEFKVIEGGDENYPLGEKWRIGEYVRQYDQVVYLDADVVLAPDCPDLFAAVPAGALGVRDDWPWMCVQVGANGTRRWMDPEVERIRRAANRPGPRLSTCYNTGVLVLSPEHAGLFDPPKVPLPKFHCTEQHWFNLNVMDQKPDVFELPWELHWHPFIDRDRSRTAGVKVWHFAGETDRAELLRRKVAESA